VRCSSACSPYGRHITDQAGARAAESRRDRRSAVSHMLGWRRGQKPKIRAAAPPGQVIGFKAWPIVIRRVFRGTELKPWDLRVDLARQSTETELQRFHFEAEAVILLDHAHIGSIRAYYHCRFAQEALALQREPIGRRG
jgi:hypothetical protein